MPALLRHYDSIDLNRNKDFFHDDVKIGDFLLDSKSSPRHKELGQQDNKSRVSIVFDENNNIIGKVIDDDGKNLREPWNDTDNDFFFLSSSSTPFTHKAQLPKKSILKHTKSSPARGDNEKRKSRRASFFFQINAGSTNTSSTKKKVNFSSYDEIACVMPLQPYGSDIWWNNDDYDRFKRSDDLLLNALPAHSAESWVHGIKTTELYAHRGLEHKCCEKEGAVRKEKVEGVMKEVLNEQYRQSLRRRRGRGFDHLTVARVSIKNTKWARSLALATGYADANAVSTDFNEEEKKNRVDFLKLARKHSDVGQDVGRSRSSLVLKKIQRKGRSFSSLVLNKIKKTLINSKNQKLLKQ